MENKAKSKPESNKTEYGKIVPYYLDSISHISPIPIVPSYLSSISEYS